MDQEQIKAEYLEIEPLLKDFVAELTNQIRQELRVRNIQLAFPVGSRTKQLPSLLNKINEGTVNLKKSITEIQDLAGLRFVTLYKKEIPEIEKIIESLYPHPKRYNNKDKSGDDHFGYSSQHFIISPPENWATIPHLSKFVGLLAEIQVRTLSEHIWAECSHSLNYKSVLNIPPNIKRPLHRLSAILEIVDSELDHIKRSHQEYKNEVEKLEIGDLLSEDLNALTIEKLLKIVFAKFKALPEEQYATLNKVIEKDFEIRTLPFLMSIVTKYLHKIPNDQNLDHADAMGITLKQFKENNYT